MLLVPYIGEITPVDARLMRLAGFLGVRCEPVLLDRVSGEHAGDIGRGGVNERCCLVVNPQVIKQWTDAGSLAELADVLTCRFSHLVVHSLEADEFSEQLVKTLSGDVLSGIRRVSRPGGDYDIGSDSGPVCGPFSGLSFGPVNPANDRILVGNTDNRVAQRLISIGSSPFMAAMKRGRSEILFLASADVLDVDEEVGSAALSAYFSRVVPHAMALRYLFGEQCWHPCEHYATVIIDDPLLRLKYGFLNFDALLRLMDEHEFSTTIAFIPHNYRRSSGRIVEMFRANSGRLAICFHGNDHTAAELAATDRSRLNTMLQIAETRMNRHTKATGLSCQKVMVFPQGNFSVEAMTILKARNFCAAVNTDSHPTGHPVALTFGELAQPALLRYGGFPLFLRKPIGQTTKQDIAFALLFGKPVLIGEHHDLFRRPETLAEMALMIKSVAQKMCWSDLETVLLNSTLRRRTSEGAYEVRAYSSTVRITNDQDSRQQFSVAWDHSGQCPSVEEVLQGGAPYHCYEVDDSHIRLSAELGPGESQVFSAVYRNDHSALPGLGLQWNARAFIRRRLCEVRDNYFSKIRHWEDGIEQKKPVVLDT
jgi:hypothetical protein